MSTEDADALRFQKAGALVPGTFYLERDADRQILEALRAGDVCHVLASRQVGKSSLKNRAVAALRAEGRRVAVADLSGLGVQDVTEDSWCYSLARTLYRSAGSRTDLTAIWDGGDRETVSARLGTALRALALEDTSRPAVIVLDEIDLLIDLPFRENVLQALRSAINDRSVVPGMERLALCTVGVAVTTDVAPDVNHSPFVGRAIVLDDFTREQLAPLESGLANLGADPAELLDTVWDLTHGHPAMTQNLCAELVELGSQNAVTRKGMIELADRVFLGAGPFQDQILVDVERRFAAPQNSRQTHALSRYRAVLVRDVWSNEVLSDAADIAQEALLIAGLVRVEGATLRIRNWILARVFDRTWVDAKLSGRRFARALDAWLDLGRPLSGLLGGQELSEALAWLRMQNEPTVEEREFLAASEQAEKQRLRSKATQRRTVIGALVLVVASLAIALGLSVTALRRARESRDHLDTSLIQQAALLGHDPNHALDGYQLALDAVARRSQEHLSFDVLNANPFIDLRAQPDAFTTRRLAGHAGPVTTASFSPDGQRVVTGSDDGTARIWDAFTGAVVATLAGHTGLVATASFSPDGQRMMTGSRDHTARIWDAHTGTLVANLTGHTGGVTTTSFSPDGQRVVTGSEDGTARIWDAHTGAMVATLAGHADLVATVSFSPDSQRVVTGSNDETARIWDAHTGAMVAILAGYTGPVWTASFSPDGQRVLTESYREIARIWDAHTGAVVATLAGHASSFATASFSPDGQRVAAGSSDQTARIWDAHTGAVVATLAGHAGAVLTASFSSDGQRVLTGSADHTARIWDAHTGALVATLAGHTGPVRTASFSPDGQRVLTGSLDHTARIWDARTRAVVATLPDHTRGFATASFSADGQRVVTGSWDHTARIWDAHTGVVVATLAGQSGPVVAASFSPDGQRVVTGSEDQTARIWDAHTGVVVATLAGQSGPVVTASFSPGGQEVVTGSLDQTARIWNAHTGALVATLAGHTSAVTTASFAPDGQRVVTGSVDNTARIWDAHTGAPVATLAGHTSAVTTASFSPDGQRVVTGSEDNTARVWDAHTGAVVATLAGHTGPVDTASFSPDGQRVVTGSEDHTARIWVAHTGAAVATLAGHNAAVLAALFSTDGSHVLTLDRELSIRSFPLRLDLVLDSLCARFAVVDPTLVPADSRALPWCRQRLHLPPLPPSAPPSH